MYEASLDKYHTDRRLVKAMAAKAYNYLSLVLALQSVGYYGAEFNKHAGALYAAGIVQSVTLQDLNMKSTNWNPEAELPIQ
eukprot:8511576-Karenia_brevis.AAC.1